jgi:hypothetical protein
MPTTASRTEFSGHDHRADTEQPVVLKQSLFLNRLSASVLQIPPYIHVYCSSATGFGVHGLLKSVSRASIQVLVPSPLPLRGVVQVTISHCRAVFGEVLCCVKRSGAYQVGIVFCSRHKPEIPVGCLAVIKSLDEPFTFTRGNVLDLDSNRLSIFCKTILSAGAWVRVEANGWILFGLVKAVVATSMVACCVDINLEAALPADLTALSQKPKVYSSPCPERDDAEQETGLKTNEREDYLACC